MADMSKENLEKELSSYIRHNYKNLSFSGINDLMGVTVSVSLENEYRGEGLYSFADNNARLKWKAKENGGIYQERHYKIEGKVHIKEDADSPKFKIKDTITVK